MSISDNPISSITVNDLASLIGVEESQRLDFKSTIDNSEKATDDFVRDVCSFANAEGGYLVIGASEAGRPDFCTGFVNVSEPTKLEARLTQACLDSISPRIDGLAFRTLAMPSGEMVLLANVPTSTQRPHMIMKNKRTDFLQRFGKNSRAMRYDEIRDAFLSQTTAVALRAQAQVLLPQLEVTRGMFVGGGPIDMQFQFANRGQYPLTITRCIYYANLAGNDIVQYEKDLSFSVELLAGASCAQTLRVDNRDIISFFADQGFSAIPSDLRRRITFHHIGADQIPREKVVSL